MMTHRFFFIFIILSLFCVSSQALEKSNITIAVGGKGVFYYLPLTIAERLGYFKDEGLNVEIIDFPGGAKALEALLGNSADIVSGAYEHTISMQSKGIKIKSIVMQGRYNNIVLGLSKKRAAQYQSPKDLQGLKIGITAPGSSTHHFVKLLLTQARLATDTVSFIGVGTHAGAIAAFQRGHIDALAHVDPVITQLEMTNTLVPIVDTRTAQGMQAIYGSDYMAGCIYLSADFAKTNPQTTQAIVNAMVRALRWIQRATPETIIDIVPPEYYGHNKVLYKTALKKNLESLSSDGKHSISAAQNVYHALSTFDTKVQNTKIDLTQTFDNSFVDKALKQYP